MSQRAFIVGITFQQNLIEHLVWLYFEVCAAWTFRMCVCVCFSSAWSKHPIEKRINHKFASYLCACFYFFSFDFVFFSSVCYFFFILCSQTCYNKWRGLFAYLNMWTSVDLRNRMWHKMLGEKCLMLIDCNGI